MRRQLALCAVLVAPLPAFVADPPKAKPPAPPAWTFQIRSTADLVAALRPLTDATRDLPGAFDTWVEDTFGTAGLAGIDPTRPIVGTIRPGPTADDESVAFVAIPITDSDEFLKLLDRMDAEPTPLKKHPGITEFVWHTETCHVRFTNTHALVVCNGTPADLDPKLTPDPATLFDAAAPGVASVTLQPARLDDTLTEKLLGWGPNLQHYLELNFVEAVPYELLPPATETLMPVVNAGLKRLTADAEAVTVRFIPVADAGLGVELSAKPKKGTALEKLATTPTGAKHAFATLADSPELVEFTLVKWPGREKKAKDDEEPEVEMPEWEEAGRDFVPVLDALFAAVTDGLNGEADVARLTVSSKGDLFTTLYAATVPDSAKLGKAVLAMLADPPVSFGPPSDVAKMLKTPADTFGDTAIYRVPIGEMLDDQGKARYGEKAEAAFAWTKTRLVVAWGPDAVALVKKALEAKPVEAGRVLVRANPKRADEFARRGLFGDLSYLGRYGSDADRPQDMLKLSVTADGEWRVRVDVRHDWLRYQNANGEFAALFQILGWPW